MNWKLAGVLLCLTFVADASSLRFYGNGVNDIDRVKIRIDDPATTLPGPPADVGATDFTIEYWMRAGSGNDAGSVSCGANIDWILGNVIVDRDRFSQDRKYGISLAAGRVVFGVSGAGTGDRTICGTTDLRDSLWHHVAVQRRRSDGFMWLYVDGQLQASADGPDGDISYPDNGVPLSFCDGPCTNSDPFIVLAAEKHDVGSAYPSYSGWLTEVRFSTSLRYAANFTRPTAPFQADADTAALYRFDEGSGNFIGDSAPGGASPGERRFGGSPAGPEWSTESPFAQSPGTLRFRFATESVGEGAGSVTLTVERVSGTDGAVTVNYATANGTATAGADYTARSGTLSFTAGQATATVQVPILEDTAVEGNETFTVTLSNAAGGATLGTPITATVTITDNDTAQPGSFRWSAATAGVGEGAGSVTLTVERVSGTDGAVTVNYATANGTATAGADYTARSGTLSFTAGQATATVQVPILEDTAVEGNETFTVTLSNAAGGATLGTPITATVTITDNDTAQPGSFRWSAATAGVGEGAGSVTLTVERVSGTDGAVTVNYATANGTATAGADYTARSGTLSFTAGQATADGAGSDPRGHGGRRQRDLHRDAVERGRRRDARVAGRRLSQSPTMTLRHPAARHAPPDSRRSERR